MSDIESSPSTQWQLLASEVVAALSDLNQVPPELKPYFEAHVQVLKTHLPLVYGAYYLAQGAGIQKVHELQALSVALSEAQSMAFQKALQQVLQKGAPVFLPPHVEPAEVLRASVGGDVPAVHQLPIFNETPYLQCFVPIPLNNRVIGALQVSIDLKDPNEGRFVADILLKACAAIELYLKSRQVEDVALELARLHTYGQLLEVLAGDFELPTVSEAIVKYAHATSGATRVGLLIARDYRDALRTKDASELAFTYRYFTGEGDQCPESTSVEAQLLADLVDYFLSTAAEAHVAGLSEGEASPAQPVAPKALPTSILQAPAGKRPNLTLRWIKREATDEALDNAVQNYLAVAPMNWVTYMPLVDEQQRIVGVLLFEGKDHSEKVAESLLKMQGLMYSAGHALSTALFWHDRKTLHWAKKWIYWKDGTLNTPKKRKWAYIGLPVLLFLAIMVYPMRFDIKAPAHIRPKEVLQLSAEVSGRILSVNVHEGDSVKQGDVLMTLDVRELVFQRRRLESDFLQALAEADLAQDMGDEASHQVALYKADRADAQIKSLNYQIEHGQIIAPFDGFILGPKNLQQKQGLVARLGESLIEIAKPADWEVKIQLYEQDVVYLERALAKAAPIDATLKLTADPDQKYGLHLMSEAQLSYGLEARQEDYYFISILPLAVESDVAERLRAGLSGRVAFHVGRMPVAYVLLRDVIRYIRVKWF